MRRFLMRSRAWCRVLSHSPGPLVVRSAVSRMAMRLLSGSSSSNSSPRRCDSASRVTPSDVLYSMLGLVSKMKTAATGRSFCRLKPTSKSFGRASARQTATMSSIRSARRRMCRRRSLRWFFLCRTSRKRNAGKSSVFGFWRMMRCNSTGMPASSTPPRSTGKTKDIGESAVSRQIVGCDKRSAVAPGYRGAGCDCASLVTPYALRCQLLEPLLSLQQILHQGSVEGHARVHRHVVDVRLAAFLFVMRLKIAQRGQIIGPHALGVEGELAVHFHILKLNDAVERKMHLGLVEDVEEDDVVAAMPQVMAALNHRLGIGEQVAETHD